MVERKYVVVLFTIVILTTLLWGSTLPYFGTEEFEAVLDQKTQSVRREGNQVFLLRSGANSLSVRYKLIKEAKERVFIQTFIFNGRIIGKLFGDLFLEKVQEEVTLKLLVDPIGSFFTARSYFSNLQKNGVDLRLEFLHSDSVFFFNQLRHDKSLIVDGKFAIIGGMNFSDVDVFNPRHENYAAQRDTDILIRGPVVRDIEEAFVFCLRSAFATESADSTSRSQPAMAEPLENNETTTQELSAQSGNQLYASAAQQGIDMRYVIQSPLKQQSKAISNLYVEAIKTATQSIYLETAFFIPPAFLRKALIQAANRGVEIKILTNGLLNLDLFYRYFYSIFTYRELLQAGIEIYELLPTMTHSKIAIFDNLYTIVGAYNLDIRSHYWDSENVAAIESASFAEELKKWFFEGVAKSRKVRWDAIP